ncbi:MAG: DUF1501 domain-containing protein [Verrucomicrobiota bacterium]|nr:DUF1501 domain-containing protein [Verrucomicrobiota bacterium]
MNQNSSTILNRKAFLGQSGITLGSLAVNSLLKNNSQGTTNAGLSELPHYQPKAKRVIYLFQSGGPSHIDLFDHSTKFHKLHGTELPTSVRGGQRLTGMTAGLKKLVVCGPVSPMKRRGKCGTWMSDMVPYTGNIADKITVINSMRTEAINHDPGITLINTGSQIPGRPSVGSWASYGLGSSNANMPAYIVLISQGNGKNPGQPIFSRLWGSGFLPSQHQGVLMRSGKNPLLYLNDPPGLDRSTRRKMLDDLAFLNKGTYSHFFDPEIETRIAQYEMAFRMQTAAPKIVDLSDEPESTFKLYGEKARTPGTYAYNCLLARRLAEQDVRFIQLFHRGWDQHGSLIPHLKAQCNDTDQPSAALVQDLEQRGLLEDTLVIWGGEFGRTAYSQGALKNGRDHHGRCFSIWMAGAGIKKGHVHGMTDDYCYNVVKDPVHTNDMNGTILHCLGINHEKFTFKFKGLNARLTGVEKSHVVHDILS